ncbi:hypothetical protein [Streptomyces sp. H27-H5]|uniref:hypothetical protein n=1 Tax=Streptomyces sp. H27-H5 TaxID=2996460 RepID=UPI0022707879|nr:hypothetical protein [Streptomyces sp. H27-H5]MCY0962802.1 hypothetical protein [Streptomyces sp. H27-H5]
MSTYPKTWTYPKGQLSADAVKRLTPNEQADAITRGRLDQQTGAPPRPPARGQLTREDLALMTPEQINDAADRGQLDYLLNGGTTDDSVSF